MSNDKKRMIWSSDAGPAYEPTIETFKSFAEKAAAGGATHIDLGNLPRSSWQLEKANAQDPHPEWDSWPVWARPSIGLFKMVLPAALDSYLPRAEISENLAIMKARCNVLRELGLRAVLLGHEPMWLPEQVFQDHPEWRGSEAQLPRLARHPYFSPCMDHPEVLQMYRWGMKELVTELPELDTYSMLTNDSSAAMCWSHSYPGKNGPMACKDRPLIDRVQGFLANLQDGAADAGHTEFVVDIFNCGFWIDGVSNYRQDLKKNQYIDGHDSNNEQGWSAVAMGDWFANGVYPVLGIPRTFAFLEALQEAKANGNLGIHVKFGGQYNIELQYLALYKEAEAQPTTGPASRMKVALKVATDQVGADHAEKLIEVWEAIEMAIQTTKWVFNGIQFVISGPLMTRWIIMPLVVDVERLTPDESLYFQRGRCAKNEVDARDYHAQLCDTMPTDYHAAAHVRLEYNVAIIELKKAVANLDLLVELSTGDTKDELADLRRRIKVMICFYRNITNFVEYTHYLHTRNRDDSDQVFRDQYNMGQGKNRGSMELRRVARDEMENMAELVELIQESPSPAVACYPNAEDEDGLAFHPDLVGQIKKKIKIMMKYWPLYHQYYPPLPEVDKLHIPALWDADESETPINEIKDLGF